MGLVQEFKEFAVKGNAIDMAVGIIIGAAFNKVVQSIVNDVIMPPIGLMIGGVNFKDLRVILKAAEVTPEGVETAQEVAIRYGMLINTIVEFLIIGITVFLVVKVMNSVIRKREAEEKAAAK